MKHWDISICVTSPKVNKTYTFSTIVAVTGMSTIQIANVKTALDITLSLFNDELFKHLLKKLSLTKHWDI